MAKEVRFNIEEYSFKSFGKSSIQKQGQAEDFEFSDLKKNEPRLFKEKEEINIIQEQAQANKAGFKISPLVKEHRGISAFEERERQKLIQVAVDRRVGELKDAAYEEGHSEGVKIGREEVFKQTRASAEEKLVTLSSMIAETIRQQDEMLDDHRKQILKMVQNLTKWIILRELDNDGEYLTRLFEKLITEMQTNRNILVQVNQKDFEKMPEVLELVQEKIGALNNVRVEIDYDIAEKGIVLECENGIINGTLEEQFNSLSKLFETAGING